MENQPKCFTMPKQARCVKLENGSKVILARAVENQGWCLIFEKPMGNAIVATKIALTDKAMFALVTLYNDQITGVVFKKYKKSPSSEGKS